MKQIIIDVREPDEFAVDHVNNSINIPLRQLAQRSGELEKAENIIVYCNSGNRSDLAKNILQQLGFTRVTDGINQEQTEAQFAL